MRTRTERNRELSRKIVGGARGSMAVARVNNGMAKSSMKKTGRCRGDTKPKCSAAAHCYY